MTRGSAFATLNSATWAKAAPAARHDIIKATTSDLLTIVLLEVLFETCSVCSCANLYTVGGWVGMCATSNASRVCLPEISTGTGLPKRWPHTSAVQQRLARLPLLARPIRTTTCRRPREVVSARLA